MKAATRDEGGRRKKHCSLRLRLPPPLSVHPDAMRTDLRGNRRLFERKPSPGRALIGWTTKLLNKREKNEISSGGFGYRYIDEPPQPLKAIKSAESEEGLEMVESSQKLLGIPNPEIELTQENEEFWNNPEFIAAFDEIDNAIARTEL
nr:uncharacterized protein LOC109154771 [Ipomoea batatas]